MCWPLQDCDRAERRVRRGSSGFVQLAQHVPTEQMVAIKFLRRGGSVDPRLIAREVRGDWSPVSAPLGMLIYCF